MKRRYLAASGAVALVAGALLVPELALAQGTDIGQRAGEWLGDQAVWLWLGIGAIGSLIFLVNQRFGQLIGFLAAMALVGIVIVGREPLKAFIEGLADTFLGG